MTTGFSDWVAAASGRAYSEATVAERRNLTASERRAVARAVNAGRVPEHPRQLAFAAALATDLERMAPLGRPTAARWLASSTAVLALLAASRGIWIMVVSNVLLGSVVARQGFVLPARQQRLPSVAREALAAVPADQRAELISRLSRPARFTRVQTAVGVGAIAAAGALVGVAVIVAIEGGVDPQGGWLHALAMPAVLVILIVSVPYFRLRRPALARFNVAAPVAQRD